jgi:CRP-like cAMP-binding protein
MALFQDMEVGKIESFVQLMQFWRFSDEAVIVKVKDEGLGLYIVDSGELVVRKGSGFMRKGESVATLKGGQIFGELSILTFTPSNADVIAKGNVALFIMGRELFRHLADGNKSFYESINEVAKKRR